MAHTKQIIKFLSKDHNHQPIKRFIFFVIP